MKRFYPATLLGLLSEIQQCADYINSASTQESQIDPELIKGLQEGLPKLRAECVAIDLPPSVLSNVDVLLTCLRESESCRHTAHLEITLANAINVELKSRLFMFIPPEDARWFNQEAKFGPRVAWAFPSAAADIWEAGNCYAAGRYGSAIYHAICALEPALRELARNVKVKWRPATTTWGTAVRQIEAKIAALLSPKPKVAGQRQRRMAKKVLERQAFLRDGAKEFKYFKDKWRDPMAHARLENVEKEDAETVLTHARSFMVHLSSRLKEKGVVGPPPSSSAAKRP